MRQLAAILECLIQYQISLSHRHQRGDVVAVRFCPVDRVAKFVVAVRGNIRQSRAHFFQRFIQVADPALARKELLVSVPRTRSICPAKPDNPYFRPSVKILSLTLYCRTLNCIPIISKSSSTRGSIVLSRSPMALNICMGRPAGVHTPLDSISVKGTSFGNSLLNNGSAYPRPTPMSPIFAWGVIASRCFSRYWKRSKYPIFESTTKSES